jgi:hypothetical protein
MFLFTCSLANSQNSQNPQNSDNHDKGKFSFDIGADLVSRYLWRGIPLSLNSNIQPGVSLSYNKFSIGAWGSYSLSSGYSETDMLLTYDLGYFTVGISDYFNEDENDLSANDFGNFRNSDSVNTPHTLEGSITFNGTDKFPLSLTLATFFYGADKDENNKNYFSTYLEAAYALSFKDNEIKLFVGGTPGKGYYSDKAAIVNAGITATHKLEISNSFSLPVYTSFIVNPKTNNVFLILGMTF